MHISMLRPLLLMVAGFQLLYFYQLVVRVKTGVLQREARTAWVAELVASNRV